MTTVMRERDVDQQVCTECTDSWEWLAVYRDGESIFECPGDGTHHGFADIDQDRLDRLAWLPKREGLSQIVVMMTSPTMRPILFRRRSIELQVGDGDPIPHQTIHCLGWQNTLSDGTNVQSLTFAFSDGSVLISDDWNAVF